ncbi:bacteriophage tail assembly protein [Opitutaceae bacterium TAV1]|nr:bacteriophage tail assembly protein [Opitutaceae bacterium TAV1]
MDEIRHAWLNAWRKPDRRQIYTWAREDLNLQGDYRTKGKFHVETSRHLILPFNFALNDQVRMINLLKGVQTAGSLVGDIFFDWALKNQPAPMMMTYQSDDDAEQHYVTRIEPTLRATDVLWPILERVRKKRDLYQFPAMNVYFQGANMNSLQRKSIRYEVNDEVWDWKPGMLSEAWARTEGYQEISKIFNISQGGEEGTDWDMCWHDGRRYEWGWHCRECRHHQPLAFFSEMLDDSRTRAGIVWSDIRGRDGQRDIDRCAASARLRCCRCGREHPDEPATWEHVNTSGDYLCLDPDRSVTNVSLHWSSLVNGRYASLVREFLRANQIKKQGNTDPLKKFYQKKLAQMWSDAAAEEKVVLSLGEYLKEPALTAGYVPASIDREINRCITADFQEGRGSDTRHFIIVCRAWRDDGSSRLLWEGRLNTPADLYALQIALDVAPACVCVDGGHARNEVATWCARYGWTVLIGDDLETFPHTPRHRKRGEKPTQRPYSMRFKIDPRRGQVGQGRRFAHAFTWSNPTVKKLTWNLRHGRGARWELPTDLSADYKAQIDTEVRKRVLDKKTGRPRYWWVTLDENNHAWDCENMQTVFALMAGILAEDIEDETQKENSPTPSPDGSGGDVSKLLSGRPIAPHDQPQQLTLLE